MVPAKGSAQTAMSNKTPRASALSKRIMLVCSETASKTAKYLRNAGHQVTRVTEGTTALSQAKRKHFDLVVLVSTGKTMDLTETALNLHDVSPSTRIIILANAEVREEIPMSKTGVTQTIPQTQVLTSEELETFLRCI
jgi:DNA-binding response OmpR family regulator